MSEQLSNILPTWTDERIKELKYMAANNRTCSYMADVLGVTRNAVIGKLHRLNMPLGRAKAAPAKPKKRKQRQPHLDRVTASRAQFDEALQDTDLSPEDLTASVSFFEAGEGHCRWPLTDPAPISEFRFCGGPQFAGCSYCRRHYRMGHQGPQTRARERGERRAA